MTFEDCLRRAMLDTDLVAQFNRLTGCTLGVDERKPIERMIDAESGYQEVLDQKASDEMEQFASFVFMYVYLPLVLQGERG